MQPYTYTACHISGVMNNADGLSRLPIDGGESNLAEQTEEFAFSVATEAVPGALTLAKINEESSKDETLNLIKEAIKSGDWSIFKGSLYNMIRDEFWTYEDIIMRGNRIVMPEQLQKRTLQLAHEGHQGMTRTKSRLRDKVWWANMDKEAEALVRACHPCQLVGPRPHPEPVRSTPLPMGPWTDLAIDLCGPLPNGDQLFVIVDYYSRWPEVIWLRNTNTQSIIRCLESVFNLHGLPETIRSDNGPQFASGEFDSFCDYLGIQHLKGIPYWPQSNGEVERFNSTILKIVRIANVQGQDLKRELGNFLFQYRTTPHSTTGVAPSELLMGRKLRDKIPSLGENLLTAKPNESDWQRLVRDRDAFRKQRYKEHADSKRGAATSDIKVGDKVLLQAKKQNKLSCSFETDPVVVVAREGNAIKIQTPDGVKMRNVAHAKPFVAVDPPPVLDLEADVSEDTTKCPDPPDVPNPPDPPVTNIPPASTRKSSRMSVKPAYLNDYVAP